MDIDQTRQQLLDERARLRSQMQDLNRRLRNHGKPVRGRGRPTGVLTKTILDILGRGPATAGTIIAEVTTKGVGKATSTRTILGSMHKRGIITVTGDRGSFVYGLPNQAVQS